MVMTKGHAMWDDDGFGYDMMDGGGAAMMVVGILILMLSVLALVSVFVTLYLHQGGGRRDTVPPTEPTEREARRLLDRRLALGEITPEEYATIRAALDG